MPTLTRNTYVSVGTLGGLATAAYDMYDWSQLLAEPEKRGEDWTVNGVDGATAVDRVRAPLRAICKVRVDGRFDSDGAAQAATVGVYTNWGLLKALAEVKTVQTVELFAGGVSQGSASAYVDLSAPRPRSSTLWEGDMYIVIPAGALT